MANDEIPAVGIGRIDDAETIAVGSAIREIGRLVAPEWSCSEVRYRMPEGTVQPS